MDEGRFGMRCLMVSLLCLAVACSGGRDSPTLSGSATGATPTDEPSSSTASPATTAPTTEPAPTSAVSSSAAPLTPTTTTVGPPPDPTIEGFRSPTGSIHCELTAEQARCSHHGNTPWKVGGDLPNWAGGMSFGFTEVGCIAGRFVGFDVAATGFPKSTCGDSLYTAPEDTLAYGERRTVGALSCLSQRFGMTCLNSDGNGFRMATNEIAMLYDRADGWEATSSSTAEDLLVPAATTVLDEQTLVSTESDSARCFLTHWTFLEPPIASAECAPGNVDWSPSGRSCAGADFNGYYVDDDVRAEAYGVATFGCTTDLSPLSGLLGIPIRPLAPGEAVATGGITCLSTGPAIACYNADGNGVLTGPDEVSFFYGRDV